MSLVLAVQLTQEQPSKAGNELAELELAEVAELELDRT